MQAIAPQTLTADEKATARVIRDAMRPRLNPDAYRAAIRASREAHGEDRHDIIKWHAMHMKLSA